MKIWNGANPFAMSSMQVYYREGDRVYSFCQPQECEESFIAAPPSPRNLSQALRCGLFVREHRRAGCHHRFHHPHFLGIEHIQGGNLFYRLNDNIYLAEPGDVCLLRPDADSDIITGPAGYCDKCSVSIEGPMLEPLLEYLGIFRMDIFTPSDKCLRLERCFERIERYLKELSPVVGEHLAGICLELLEVVAHWQLTEDDNPEMAAIIACMERHIGSPFSIPQLARELGVSSSTLIRRCRQSGNVTPIQLMTRLRMNRAATMLLDDKMRVNEISAALGYENALNFSTSFKAFFGSSPRNYRKKNLLYH